MSKRPLSREEMREARLRALGQSIINDNKTLASSSAPNLNQSTTFIPVEAHTQIDRNINQNSNSILSHFQELEALLRIIYSAGPATEDDMVRWSSEGFIFWENPIFGLRQGHGGPCGILAVVQAEIIQHLFYDANLELVKTDINTVSKVEAEEALLMAFVTILSRVSGNSNRVAVASLNPSTLNNYTNIPISMWNVHDIQIFTSANHNKDALKASIISKLDQFQSPLGCILFLLSVMYTR
jgi:hypothetical protein